MSPFSGLQIVNTEFILGNGVEQAKEADMPHRRETEMSKATTSVGGWWLHGVVLAIVIVAEFIGIRRLSIGIGTVIFLPILYAFALGIALNPHIFKKMGN